MDRREGPALVQAGPFVALSEELPRPLAFVLTGGAASGASQVGMLQALQAAGLQPDLIVGTSVGAINGAMVAADPDNGAQRLGDAWSAIDRDGLLGSSSLRCLPRLVRTRRHLFSPEGLQTLIRGHLDVETFEELDARFVAVATAAVSGTAATLASGALEPALLASTAIPGVFPRVEIAGDWYFDGGVTANVPVRQALELGAQSVLVLNAAPVAGNRELPTNIAETLQYAVHLMMRCQAAAEPLSRHAGRPVITLPQTTPPDVGVFDFDRAEELIGLGYAATQEWLDPGSGHSHDEGIALAATATEGSSSGAAAATSQLVSEREREAVS